MSGIDSRIPVIKICYLSSNLSGVYRHMDKWPSILSMKICYLTPNFSGVDIHMDRWPYRHDILYYKIREAGQK